MNCPETYTLLHFGHTFSVAYTLLTNINIGLLRCIPLSYAVVVVSLFLGHLARMDENADDSQAVFEPPPGNWRRPPGRPRTTWMKNIHDDMSSLDLGIHEARDLVPNRPLCRLMSFFAQRYARVVVPATIRLDMLFSLWR